MEQGWTKRALEQLGREIDIQLLEPSALSGESREARSFRELAQDFGHLKTGRPAAIARPRDAQEVRRLIEWMKDHGVPLTPRGKGLSQSGQSIAVEGISLETSALQRMGPVDVAGRRITCGTGVPWMKVLEAGRPHGLIPQVHTLNLETTVGGVISVGGVGANSHRFGLVAGDANVVELEMVTGDGEVVRCSREENPEVFDAVRGGLGLCGVITSVTFRLRPVPRRVRFLQFLYDSIEPWLQDQHELTRSPRCDYLEGFCWASAKGMRSAGHGRRRPFAHWLYGLHVGIELQEGEPDDLLPLPPLHPWRVLAEDIEDPFAFAQRYQPRFERMRRTGAWNESHPWLECFLPEAALPDVLPRILDVVPLALGDGHRLLWVDRNGAPPLLALPEAQGNVACFAILPMGVPEPDREECVGALREIHRIVVDAQGKRYVSGYIDQQDRDWQRHYGSRYERWHQTRRRYDPAGILGSVLFPPEK